MRKVVALALALTMVFSLTACGNAKDSGKAAETKAAETKAAETKAAETKAAEAKAEAPKAEKSGAYDYVTSTMDVEINLASLMNDGLNEVAAQDFKEKVEAATDGHIKVILLLQGVAGGESENLNQVSTGELEMVLGGSNYSAQILTEWNATGIPFLFSTYDQVEEFWTKYADEMAEVSLASNIRLLGLLRRGARDLTCNRLIEHPADLKGLVLRLPENATWQAVWAALGCECTPVNMQEVFTAIQTGVVEGQENPIGTTYENNLHEVCKYDVLTHHIVQHFPWMVNEKFWQSLPEDYQRLLQEVIDYEVEWAKGRSEVNDAEYRAKAEAEGMQFLEINADEFRAAAREGIMKAAEPMNDLTKDYVKKMLGE